MNRLSEKLSQWRWASALFLVILGVLVVAAAPARADVCSIDLRPAATLLLPYFEVDPNDAAGLTTMFSINNASAAAVLANVVVWTDLGVPTMGFQVYLTGYDVQTINLRDIFINGNLPGTASAGQDPVDTISPKGQVSQDLNFASCTGILPYPQLPAAFVTHLQLAHSGRFSSVFNGCAGQYLGDSRLRGYITIDVVSDCTQKYPSDPGYFGSGGVASDQNVLWGDYFYVDPSNKYSDGENLVRIKAFPGAFEAGDATFYSRQIGSLSRDDRQPLPTSWGSRFLDGGVFSGGTDVVVWRDIGRTAPFACGTNPAGYPMDMQEGVVFDEQEQVAYSIIGPPGPRPQFPTGVFPAAANKVHAGGPALPVPFNFGWMHLDLNPPAGWIPTDDGTFRQAWVTTVMKAQGQYSVGIDATPFDSGCSPALPLNVP